VGPDATVSLSTTPRWRPIRGDHIIENKATNMTTNKEKEEA